MAKHKVFVVLVRIACLSGEYALVEEFSLWCGDIDEDFLLVIHEDDRPISIVLDASGEGLAELSRGHEHDPDIVVSDLFGYPLANIPIVFGGEYLLDFFVLEPSSFVVPVNGRPAGGNSGPAIKGGPIVSGLCPSVHKQLERSKAGVRVGLLSESDGAAFGPVVEHFAF